jgi:ribosomal protein S12 methylthiotransferase accessory factor
MVAVAAWRTADHARDVAEQERCRAAGLPVLLCRPAAGRYVIGPFVLPGVAGCAGCARSRLLAAAGADDRPVRLPSPAPWERAAQRAVPSLVRRYLTGDDEGLYCSVWEIGPDGGGPSRHRFLPVPACPHCGSSAAGPPVTISFTPRPMTEPARLRLRSVPELHTVRAAAVDPRYGIIRRVDILTALPGKPAVAVPAGRRARELAGVGREADAEAARTAAVLEALERLAGMPGGRRPAACGRHAELPAQALDPRSVAQHRPDAFGRPGSALRPYTPATSLSWTQGYSFARGPLLVPEQLGYHLLPERSRAELCWQETSNGCALGSCLEEAILHGLLEVIERDAFLGCWYSRSRPRRLVTAAGPLRHALGLLRCHGYTCDLFDITWDIRVPVVWALARAAGDRAAEAWSISGICAHPDPFRAIAGALREIRSQVGLRDFAARPRAELTAMLADPALVRTPADHRHVHAIPAAARRFGFVRGAPAVTVGAAYSRCGGLIKPDLTASLRALVARVAECGLDVIAVDQTTAEQRQLGLRTAKVIVPGTIPMTFGHAFRRTAGVPRLVSRRFARPGPELPHCLA